MRVERTLKNAFFFIVFEQKKEIKKDSILNGRTALFYNVKTAGETTSAADDRRSEGQSAPCEENFQKPQGGGAIRFIAYRLRKKFFNEYFLITGLSAFARKNLEKQVKTFRKAAKMPIFHNTARLHFVSKKLHKYNILWFFCFNVQNVATATHIEPVVVVYFVSQPKGRKCGDVAPFVRRNIYKLNRGEKNENYQEKRSGNGVRSQ
ncbi:MAG: hypothetical protein PUI31_02390 [Clostridia bacterium]|nr:hypothetical protein [Clostridia bacterium]MDD7165515.1 hypothetical protein [Clostridia bacterium]